MMDIMETVLGFEELERISHDWDTVTPYSLSTRGCASGTCDCPTEPTLRAELPVAPMPSDQWKRAQEIRNRYGSPFRKKR